MGTVVRLVFSEEHLLALTGTTSIEQLSEVLDADADLDIELEPEDGGREVRTWRYGTALRYPFRLRDLYAVVEAVQAETLRDWDASD